MYSNRYIFVYATIMVIVVAAVLSTAAMYLKPFQQANIRTEKIKSILASANVESTSENAEELYEKFISEEILINEQGEVVSLYKDGKLQQGEKRAFDVEMKVALKKMDDSKEKAVFPLFVANKEGEKLYIIPVYGKGLWGPVWGNVALESDWKTVAGATFAHKAETPGLGAEIDTREFQAQFVGKTIFDDNNDFTSITIVKGGIVTMPEEKQIHGVDAISGGTITSNGVTDMLDDCLRIYLPYIKKQQ